MVGRSDRASAAGHRDRADVGAHAGGDRDGRDDDGPPLRRALHPRPRRLRPPGRRGLVRPPFAKPLARTREYIAILRDVFARKAPVTAPGPHYPLPYPDGTGLGKPLRSTLHPVRETIPIFLGAEGPKNIALCGELCDGWLALFFAPRHEGFYRDALAEGFAREGARRSFADFEVCATVPLIVHDDVEVAADMLRPMYALYFGGMGARGANFHHDVAVRMGYEAEAKRCQDLYLEGRKDEAAAAIPTKLVEEIALIGPPEKIRHDLEAWRDSIVTTILVSGPPELLRQAAELVLG